MKVVQVTNVDFSLRHFLLPLMRGAAARGHEVVGVCADGPLLAELRCTASVPGNRESHPLAAAFRVKAPAAEKAAQRTQRRGILALLHEDAPLA